MLPAACRPGSRAHLDRVRVVHARDLATGGGCVPLPGALAPEVAGGRGASGRGSSSSRRRAMSVDPRAGRCGGTTCTSRSVQRAVKRAVRASGIPKRATCHSFRHSFATHSVGGWVRHPDGAGAAGARGRATTMIYTHVLNRGGFGVRSPLDRL